MKRNTGPGREAAKKENLVLVLGGARSGKSSFAQGLAGRLGDKVLFVATGEARDPEMKERIQRHRQARPSGWQTLETPQGVGKAITGAGTGAEVIIIDCLTLLVSNLLTRGDEGDAIGQEEAEARVKKEMEDLLKAMDESMARFIVVSNEVGLGLVPDNRLGRLYRDLLGTCNQALAQRASEVYFLAAGLPLKIKGEDQG